VIGNLHNIDNRRLSILQSSKFCKRFGVDECWGEGLMIFVPFARSEHQKGLKNRFLPLLTDAKLESFFPGSKRPDWKKETMCDLVVQGVKGWVNHHPHYPGEGILDRAFCTWASRCEVGKKIALEEAVEKTRAVWTEQKMPIWMRHPSLSKQKPPTPYHGPKAHFCLTTKWWATNVNAGGSQKRTAYIKYRKLL
jgi:hypothetical protein